MNVIIHGDYTPMQTVCQFKYIARIYIFMYLFSFRRIFVNRSYLDNL